MSIIQFICFGSIFLSDIINLNDNNINKYIYKFKIIKTYRDDIFGLYNIKNDKPELNDWFTYTNNAECYCFHSNGYLVKKGYAREGKYGKSLNKGDILSIIILRESLSLSFNINNINYNKAFNINKQKYKIGVSLYANHCIEFLECKKF
mmetsp:Transcript_86635/g.106310  ORF Transcript_86635/g.106310 Transcript_86635/m.106310 type:complete len:149 (-) Transcript_86635:112-558(-)